MQVAGMNAATQDLVDTVESSIVSGRTTDAQANRLFLARIADKIEKLTFAVAQLRDSKRPGRRHARHACPMDSVLDARSWSLLTHRPGDLVSSTDGDAA